MNLPSTTPSLIPSALAIGGFDPSGGAGIAQDLRTFAVCSVWGLGAITAVTVQDTIGVRRFEPVAPATVADQIDAVIADTNVQAAKTGMLVDGATVVAVAEALTRGKMRYLVVDPVLRSGTGATLTSDGSIAAIIEALLPLATLITPNADEATALTGIQVESVDDQRRAARALRDLGARAVLVKGGHVPGANSGGDVVDILDDGGEIHELWAPRVAGVDLHGTGCCYAAAITAGLARGQDLVVAVREAKGVVDDAIRRAKPVGKGRFPVMPEPRTGPWKLAGHPFE